MPKVLFLTMLAWTFSMTWAIHYQKWGLLFLPMGGINFSKSQSHSLPENRLSAISLVLYSSLVLAVLQAIPFETLLYDTSYYSAIFLS